MSSSFHTHTLRLAILNPDVLPRGDESLAWLLPLAPPPRTDDQSNGIRSPRTSCKGTCIQQPRRFRTHLVPRRTIHGLRITNQVLRDWRLILHRLWLGAFLEGFPLPVEQVFAALELQISAQFSFGERT